MSLKTQDDAHRQSNSKDKWVRQVRVEILPDKLGVTPGIAKGIQNACQHKRMFVIYSETQAISFDPETLTSHTKGMDMKYDNAMDFLNGVKLSLVACNKLYIEPKQLTNANLRKRIQ